MRFAGASDGSRNNLHPERTTAQIIAVALSPLRLKPRLAVDSLSELQLTVAMIAAATVAAVEHYLDSLGILPRSETAPRQHNVDPDR